MENSKLVSGLKKIDDNEYPDFYQLETILEKSLWVLWIVKDKLSLKKMTIEQIELIIREVKEYSINIQSIRNALSRAGDKIHIHREKDKTYYEIMKPGKEFLVNRYRPEAINLFYFEAGKKYSSKRVLINELLESLKGELRIVDPYCGTRTLDILRNVKIPIKLMTRIENLKEKQRNILLREIPDFKSEYSNIEIRSYPNNDIHDRYILSADNLIILGYSIQNLGNKESFAIILSNESNRNISEALLEVFNRRWKQSKTL